MATRKVDIELLETLRRDVKTCWESYIAAQAEDREAGNKLRATSQAHETAERKLKCAMDCWKMDCEFEDDSGKGV